LVPFLQGEWRHARGVAKEARMKVFISTTIVAVCATVLTGQSSVPPPGQPAQQPADVVAVTGCVAMGAGAGEYTLTDATRMPAAADKAAAEPARGKPDADHAMSYLLLGSSADLKVHVGHKVTVTGTMVKPAISKTTPPSERDKASRPMSGGTVNVTSVKMVSSTCP
jgi:hypothetical protein